MKKILSFFVILSILTISNFHNSVMAFCDTWKCETSMSDMQDSMDSSCCGDKEIKKESKKCNSDCCYSDNYNSSAIYVAKLETKEKVVKIIFKNPSFSFVEPSFDFSNKNILNLNSPPWIKSKISGNYAYHNLVKIIKSNT